MPRPEQTLVRLRVPYARGGGPLINPGEEASLEQQEAASLVDAGQADYVDALAEAEEDETDVARGPATKAKAPGRPPKDKQVRWAPNKRTTP